MTMPKALTGMIVGARVDGRDGPLGTFAGVREGTSGYPMGYVLVRLWRLLGLAHTTHLVPAAWVRETRPGAQSMTLDATRAEVAGFRVGSGERSW